MKINNLALAFAAAVLFALSAGARTYVIADTTDSTNVTSLRGAVMDANRRGGNNTILLSQPVYPLTLTGANEDAGLTGDLDVKGKGKITIASATTANVTIDATGLGDRVVHVLPGARLSLVHLIITGGSTLDGTNSLLGAGQNGGDGGGIFNAGTLSLVNCTVSGNVTGSGGKGYPGFAPGRGGHGGGVYSTGTIQIQNSVISGNACGSGGGGTENAAAGSGGDGGGVYNTGPLTLMTSTINGNFCGTGGIGYTNQGTGGHGGNGGGIFTSNTVVLTRCTVSGNIGGTGGRAGVGPGSANGGAGGDGGGVYNIGVLTLNTCTLSGNSGGTGGKGGDQGTGGTGGNGGGLFSTRTFSLLNCTISDNVTGNGGTGGDAYLSGSGDAGGMGGDSGDGGGVVNAGPELSSAVRNSLIALNLFGDVGVGGAGSTPSDDVTNFFPDSGTNGAPGIVGSGPDVSGDFGSAGFNLIGDADGSAGFANGLLADQVGDGFSPIDPLLGPLQDNGGPTATQALLPGSPAIDQGRNTKSSIDQRGVHRPVNVPTIIHPHGGNGSDIGAFELNQQ